MNIAGAVFGWENLIAWVILGIIAGLIVTLIDNRNTQGGGIASSLILGIIGAVVAGFLARLSFGAGTFGLNSSSLTISILGGLVVALVQRLFASEALGEQGLQRGAASYSHVITPRDYSERRRPSYRPARGKLANPVKVQKFLDGVEYPATRREILRSAEMEGADEDVLYTLDQIPNATYRDPAEVSEAIGELD